MKALPPRKDCFDTAAEIAVAIRALPECGAAVSTGDDLDIQFRFGETEFRFAFDEIHGMVIECDADNCSRVQEVLKPLCGGEANGLGDGYGR